MEQEQIVLTEEQKQRMRLWTAALKSGDFPQTQGVLRTAEDAEYSYCCLGVGTEIALRNGCELNAGERDFVAKRFTDQGLDIDQPSSEHPAWNIANEEMCQSVAEWYGLPEGDPFLGNDEVCTQDCGQDECDCADKDARDIRAIIANDDLHWDFNHIADALTEYYELESADAAPSPAE